MADVCFWKSEIVISAAYCFMTTEFGLLIATDIRKRATSPDLKPELKLCRSSRHLENRYNIISTVGGSIWTKFGNSLQNSTQITAMWSIANGRFLTAKLKVLLRRIFLCFPNAVWASASGGLCIISDTLVGSLLMSIS